MNKKEIQKMAQQMKQKLQTYSSNYYNSNRLKIHTRIRYRYSIKRLKRIMIKQLKQVLEFRNLEYYVEF